MNEDTPLLFGVTRRVTFARWQIVVYPLIALVLFVLIGLGLRLTMPEGGEGLLQRESLPGAALIYAANFLVFAGSTVVLAVWPGKISWAELGIAPPRWRWSWLAIALGVSIALLPARMIVGAMVQMLFGGGLESMQARLALFGTGDLSWARFLVTLVGAGLLAPIAEELFFRGFFYTALRQRLGIGVSVAISSTVFAAGHADALGVVASSLIIGVALALLYEYTRSLWIPIAVHAANNTMAVVLAYLLTLVTQALQ